MIVTLFGLLVMHALCDGPLQGPVLSAAKRPDGVPGFPWQIALAAHSLLHAAAVALVTASWWLGAAELAAHAMIDFLKCRDRIGTWTDQVLHVGCKVLWVVILVRGAT